MVAVKGSGVTVMTSFNATGWSSPLRTSPNESTMRAHHRHVPLRAAIRPAHGATRRRTRRARHNWQVFGLTGSHSKVHLLAVASQLPIAATSADDGGRSCIPLRDSPGFPPGSLSRCAWISAHRSMPPAHRPLANQLQGADYRACPRATTAAAVAGSRRRLSTVDTELQRVVNRCRSRCVGITSGALNHSRTAGYSERAAESRGRSSPRTPQ